MKISVFVDGANIFYMQKDELKWWINFEKLLRWIENRTGGEIIDAYYYVGEENPPDTRQQGFLTALADIGYSIITKELKIIVLDDGREIRKANLDIEIVLDMFNTIENYDMAILVSGDGDFAGPGEEVHGHVHKKVHRPGAPGGVRDALRRLRGHKGRGPEGRPLTSLFPFLSFSQIRL